MVVDKTNSARITAVTLDTMETLDGDQELCYFSSDHAVSERQKTAEQEENSSANAPVSSVDIRRPSHRQSLHWNDLFGARRLSSQLSSLVSSLTLTDYGESFFNDYGSQADLFRWDEECDCNKEEGACACSPPVCPMRRDSMSTGKISSNKLGPAKDIAVLDRHKECAKDISFKLDSSANDQHPIKPGRRESAATVDQQLDANCSR